MLFCKCKPWSDFIVLNLNREDNKIVSTYVIIMIHLMISTTCGMSKQVLFCIIYLYVYYIVLFALLILSVSFKCDTSTVLMSKY